MMGRNDTPQSSIAYIRVRPKVVIQKMAQNVGLTKSTQQAINGVSFSY